jgi:exosome complex component RRP42
LILSDAGNIHDALFLAARAALWDTKVPKTRSVEYKAPKNSISGSTTNEGDDMDVDTTATSGFSTRTHLTHATDFELPDYWDEGEALNGGDRWPVCITLNLVSILYLLSITKKINHTIQITLQDASNTLSRRNATGRSRCSATPIVDILLLPVFILS